MEVNNYKEGTFESALWGVLIQAFLLERAEHEVSHTGYSELDKKFEQVARETMTAVREMSDIEFHTFMHDLQLQAEVLTKVMPQILEADEKGLS